MAQVEPAIGQGGWRPSAAREHWRAGQLDVLLRIRFSQNELAALVENDQHAIGVDQRAFAEPPLCPHFFAGFRLNAFEGAVIKAVEMLAQ